MMEFKKQKGHLDRGFVLLSMGVSVVVLLGMLGLALDLGRTFIAKNEAQAFTDAAALAAVSKLNGTSAGITASEAAVTNSTNRWNFATQAFSSVTTEFSPNQSTWYDSASAPINSKYVRVTAPNNSVAMSVIRAVPGVASSITVAARSVAGSEPPTSYSQGVFPFAPIAHDLNDTTNWGYSFGDELTLLWPSSIGSNGESAKLNNLCASDRNQAALDAVKAGITSDRGYIQDSSADAIAAAIEDDHMDYTVTLNESVSRTGGVKTTDVYQSLQARVNQDTQPNTVDYTGYLNGHSDTPLRRKVIVPIINDVLEGAGHSVVKGFAYVFLPASQPHNPNDSKCATYIGPASLPGGNLGNGSNFLRLMQ
ncbi:MAG TPA: pilus assembly protein TadG-related protein [Bryobacteraceae bacterium]|jgi:Flp pilus assembly protein TadG|nr:pilus assembly protein TadG-related protein [Bryobacteraceae bacterium]